MLWFLRLVNIIFINLIFGVPDDSWSKTVSLIIICFGSGIFALRVRASAYLASGLGESFIWVIELFLFVFQWAEDPPHQHSSTEYSKGAVDNDPLPFARNHEALLWLPCQGRHRPEPGLLPQAGHSPPQGVYNHCTSLHVFDCAAFRKSTYSPAISKWVLNPLICRWSSPSSWGDLKGTWRNSCPRNMSTSWSAASPADRRGFTRTSSLNQGKIAVPQK